MNFNNRLIIYPGPTANDGISSDIQNFKNILSLLLENKLIANKWSYQNQYYYLTGEHFLKYLTFMGCSPAIETKPDKNNLPGSNFIAIKINCLDKVIFYPGKKNYQHRCQSCKKPIFLTENPLMSAQDNFSCPHCHKQYCYQQINWRHNAGISHLFIEICGIFNGEAIPSDSFLNLLNKHSLHNNQWNYFYAQ